MLSDRDIQKALELHISIVPFHVKQLQPCSYDLTLSNSFTIYSFPSAGIRPYVTDATKYAKTVIMDEYLLQPGNFLLASTKEVVGLCEHYAARMEGKSTLARLGLMVHTAGFVDAGFEGQLTLEITNLLSVPIWLRAGMPIAQISFTELSSPVKKLYAGSYLNQKGATPSMYHEDHEVAK